MVRFRSAWIAHEVTDMKLGNVQRCRVRQGDAGVCPDAESGSRDSGTAHFPSLKSRHRGAGRDTIRRRIPAVAQKRETYSPLNSSFATTAASKTH
jgi:hypothetical protein